MRVAGIDRYDMVNTPNTHSAAFSIWFQGCTIQCPDCHNKQLWDKNGGQDMTVSSMLYDIYTAHTMHGVNCLALLGGEPLDQDINELCKLCSGAKHEGIEIWLYTGYEFDQVPDSIKNRVDVIKTGRHDESRAADKWLGFLSSSNQKLHRKINNTWTEVMHL